MHAKKTQKNIALNVSKTPTINSFRLNAPQVDLLLRLNAEAKITNGRFNNNRYEVTVSRLNEDSWVKLEAQFPDLIKDNHFSRVSLQTLCATGESPIIKLPLGLLLPDPFSSDLIPMLEIGVKAIKEYDHCTLFHREGAQLEISFTPLTGG